MTPTELKALTLTQLRALRDNMLTLDYLAEIDDLPTAERQAAAMQLTQVQVAILRLENARLRDVATRLTENEVDLRDSRDALAEALKDLQAFTTVVTAVSAFLGVVARIVTLIP